jgi:deoxyribodipyrimidine photo-lyase
LPVIVGFGVTADYPEANARHYAFMLEGLVETARALRQRGLGFAISLIRWREQLPFAADVCLCLAVSPFAGKLDLGRLRSRCPARRTVGRHALCRPEL